jgi:hypothetical protein
MNKLKKILLGITTFLFLITLTANANANKTSVSWIYDSGLTRIALIDVNISKDLGATVTGIIENKDPNATKLAVTLNLHIYDKNK